MIKLLDNQMLPVIKRANKQIKNYSLLQEDDLIQEANLVYLNIKHKHNKSKQDFNKYICANVYYRLIDFIRKHLKTRNYGHIIHLDFLDDVLYDECYSIDQEETIINLITYNIYKDRLFSYDDRNIMAMYVSGYTMIDIGKKLNLTPGRISQIIKTIIKKMRY